MRGEVAEFRVQGSGMGVQSSGRGFWVLGVGFGVQDSGCWGVRRAMFSGLQGFGV